MVEERRLAVLRAIVEDYVSTEEPVGSKALVERHGLGVSPATVRNDMAVLEEEGLIHQPHTSAGRIPTDKGYRLFVDRLGTVKPLTAAEKRAISTFLEGAVDVDDVVRRSVRLLAQLTRQVAVVQYPILSQSTVRHVEVVALAPHRLLVVLILSSGRVEQRLVELDRDLDEAQVGDLRSQVNRAVVGQRLGVAADALARLRTDEAPADGPTSEVVGVLVDALSDHSSDQRVVVGGTANLARFGDGFDTVLRPMLEALEEQVVLLRLLGEATTGGAVTVRIGAEGPVEELAGTSVVTTGYGAGADMLSALGIVGPTRMDYPGTMAAVRAVARYMSRILDENNNA
ncbi:heat-inducible transcriptional repressor HrcA [Nocardioides sp. ChNu-153]|uniref:heat-inducible transcriptional repressor HrcA n=1 Tax=unclassified Nocardioides TaxID=2615069 RepID=UPI002405E55E|nr:MULTISPECIES: heat-inducible transcriptional repressor HrcA [unclassified Nocardioides]MDF9715508.1 heat-inducible transcriptional repressor HrcA [Nocardioides sp. ChNu-99]MDN7120736.1 heat-inducible transcriptional repressor HrcA [Nocardioides sp. ChNu-153]